MGRTPTPLVIWADKAAYPDWADLVEKGHLVYLMSPESHTTPSHAPPDIIVGEAAHFWGPGMKPYREAALKRARTRRRS